MRAVDITPDAEGVRPIAIYTYDAGGERILKHNNTSVSIFLNGKMVADTIQTDATIYPSGMLVAKLGNNGSEEEQTLAYTKHYYSGTQRVSSKIGTTENLGDFLQDWFTGGIGGPVDVVGSSNNVLTNAEEGVIQVYDELGIEAPEFNSTPVFIPVASFTHGAQETENYWFHPDHLGSSSYITNFVGEVSQHMEYFAFGETFVEEHRSSNNSPYKFNGKELDEETGWYYYGARYYDPRTSVWLSVDKLAEKFPNWSPYNYTLQNPVRYIDPDGNSPTDIIILGKDGQILMVLNDFSAHITIIDPQNEGKLSLSSYYTRRDPINWNNRNRRIVANVADYYRKEAGLKHSVGATYEVDEGTTAHTTPEDEIYIVTQANGRPHPSLNNKYNLQKTLFHENGHADEKIDGAYKYSDHANIYLKVMQSSFYSKADEDSQKSDIMNFFIRIQKSKDAGETGYKDLIKEFNKSNVKGGYNLRDRDSGGIQLFAPNGKEVLMDLGAAANVKNPSN